jgi:hypothetical protein
VPAGAVIQRPQALSGIIGRKGCVGGCVSRMLKTRAQPGEGIRNGMTRIVRGMQNSWSRGEIR